VGGKAYQQPVFQYVSAYSNVMLVLPIKTSVFSRLLIVAHAGWVSGYECVHVCSGGRRCTKARPRSHGAMHTLWMLLHRRAHACCYATTGSPHGIPAVCNLSLNYFLSVSFCKY